MPRIDATLDPNADIRPNGVRQMEDMMARLRALENEEKALVVPYNQQINIDAPIYPGRDFGNGWKEGRFDPFAPEAAGNTLLPSQGFIPLDRECMGYARNAIHEFQMKFCVCLHQVKFFAEYSANSQWFDQNGARPYTTGAYSLPLCLQFISLPSGTITNFDPLIQIPVGDLTFTPFGPFPGNWQGVWNFNGLCSDYDFINDNIAGIRSGFNNDPNPLDWNTDGDKFTLQQVEGWLNGDIGKIGLQVVADTSSIQGTAPGTAFTDEYYHFIKSLGLNIDVQPGTDPEFREPLISMTTSIVITYKGVQVNIQPGNTI